MLLGKPRPSLDMESPKGANWLMEGVRGTSDAAPFGHVLGPLPPLPGATTPATNEPESAWALSSQTAGPGDARASNSLMICYGATDAELLAAPGKQQSPEPQAPSPAQRDRLGQLMKLSYGAPSFATQSISLLIAVYAADYYVLLGASLSVLSFFTAWARSLDVITDPLMAWVSDQTTSRLGRRRPYILVGAPLYAIFLTLLFSPPTNVSATATGVWFCLFYTLFYLSDTLANVPYEALGPELTTEHSERNSVFFTAKIFMFVGMLFGAVGPAVVKFSIMGGFGTAAALPCSDLSWHDNVSIRLAYRKAGALVGACTLAEPCVSHSGLSCHRVHSAEGVDGTSGVYMFNATEMEAVCGSAQERTGDMQTCSGGLWADACLDSTGMVGGADRGGGLCLAATRFDTDDSASQRISFTVIAAAFGAYYMLSALNCVAVVKENVAPFLHRYKAPLVGAMIRTFHNPAFRPLLIAWTLEGIGLSALVSMFPFYVRYFVVSDGEKAQQYALPLDPQVCMGISVSALLIAAVIASPLWLWLAKKVGKYRAWLLFNFCNVTTNLLFFLPKEGETLKLIIVTAVNGFPIGGSFLVQSVLSDIIDYDEFLYGVRNEAIFSVYATLIPKFVAIPASALPLALVNMLGFVKPVDGKPQPQNATVIQYISITFVAFPLLCYAIGFCIKAFMFPLKSKDTHDAIREGVEHQKRSNKAVRDPITGSMITPLRLSEEEEDLAYALENFGPSLLTRLLASGDTNVVVQAMQRHIYVGTVFSVASLAMTAYTASIYLKDPVMAILPVTMVILFGFFVCFLVIEVLRFRAGLSLRDYPLELLMSLAKKIRDHKVSRYAMPSKLEHAASGHQRPETEEAPL